MKRDFKKCVLILARGGTKSIPRKNLIDLNGMPLVYYPIIAAKNAGIQDVYVSSEDSEICSVSLKFGAKIHKRDVALSQDLTHDIDCFKEFIEYNKGYDYIIHLRATSPQITSKIILEASREFEKNYDKIDSLRSVVKSDTSPFKMWFINNDRSMSTVITDNHSHSSPRQSLRQAYKQNACIDIVKSSTITNKSSMVGNTCLSYVMENAYNLDIDTFSDLKKAREIIEK